MISLRQVAQRGRRPLSLPIVSSTKRALVTSRQKRALNKQQLGETKAAPPSAAAAAPSSSAGSDGSSSSSIIPLIATVVVAGGAAGAYYNGMIPLDVLSQLGLDSKKEAQGAPQQVPMEEKKEEKKGSPSNTAAKPETEAPFESSGNRVVNISLPKGTSRSSPRAATTEHPAGGNRVSMEPAVPEAESNKKRVPTSVDAALSELREQISKDDTARSLLEAHKDLALLASMDLTDLDQLSTTQLKVRLVQLSKDMEERTKWEAVRLKEFLVMKEKEVEDK